MRFGTGGKSVKVAVEKLCFYRKQENIAGTWK
jgi:hypothetical protein